jgi:2-methylcitrate dehydratase PrpD
VKRIAETEGLRPTDVERIELTVPNGHLAMCNIPEPSTALEGKFSLRFTAALALARGQAGEDQFTDAATRQPDLVAIRDRVSVVTQEGDWERGTLVSVQARDGRSFSRQVNLNIPTDDLDGQWQRLEAKFRSLASPVVGQSASSELASAIRAFGEAGSAGTTSDIVRLATPTPAGAR